MEVIEQTLKSFSKENEALQKYMSYVLFAITLLVCYFNLIRWNMMVNGILIAFLAIVFVGSFVKVEIGYLLSGLLMGIYLVPVNIGLASLALLSGLILSFSSDYGKNSIAYLSIYLLLMNAYNPLIFGFAFILYGLYCMNRGFGMPLLTSITTILSACIYGLCGLPTLFTLPVFETPVENIFTYVSDRLNDPLLFEWINDGAIPNVFYETIKSNYLILLVSISFVYFFCYLLKMMKRDEKEVDLKKTMIAFVLSLVVLFTLNFFSSQLIQSEMNMNQLLMLVLGGVVGLVVTVILPNYPTSELLTFEEKQKLEEQEKLSEVVKEVDRSTIKHGWDSIAGYSDVKEELKQVLEPYSDPEIMDKMEKSHIDPVKGLLLFGPPGSGKTLFARAIAAESKMNIITVAGSEFTSKWVGESDKNLRNIFAQAQAKAPCVLFFDELESFLPQRENAQYSWEKTLVTTFLTQMDGFNELKNVLVIGATNYPDLIDPAAIRPGRFDKCIFIDAPDVEARKAILKKYLGEKTILSEDDLTKTAMKMDRYTAADIEGLIKELYRQNKYEALSSDLIIQACASYKPTVTLDMREKYESLSQKYNRRFVLEEEKPQQEKKYTWDDIAGMEEAKNSMKKYVEKPLLYADKYKEIGLPCPKGTLLFGPPGCGKTLFAKVVANECNATFFTVNGPELLSGHVGESEEKLRRVFRDAREQKPSIIFFDEFDSIAEDRSLSNSSVKLINQLLTEMDGMEELDGVLVLAATNRIDSIDPALRRPGRFDNIVYIGLPDIESREKQFELHLKGNLDNLDCNRFAQLSEGFSCADVAGVCRKIKEKLLDSLIMGGDSQFSQSECEEIVRNTNKTLSDIEIDEYKKLKSFARE